MRWLLGQTATQAPVQKVCSGSNGRWYREGDGSSYACWRVLYLLHVEYSPNVAYAAGLHGVTALLFQALKATLE